MKNIYKSFIGLLLFLVGCNTMTNPVVKEIGRLGLSIALNEVLNKNPDLEPYMRGFSAVVGNTASSNPFVLKKNLDRYIDSIDVDEESRAALYQLASTIDRFVFNVIETNKGEIMDTKVMELLVSMSDIINSILSPNANDTNLVFYVYTNAGKVVIE